MIKAQSTYTLTIVGSKEETIDTKSFTFKQPKFRKIKYFAGQFITVIVIIGGRKFYRPYSLSSAPNVDKELQITVKRVQGGIVSNYINDNLKVGDVLEVMEPSGEFYFRNTTLVNNIYLWGAGSGITPLFSIAKEILNNNQDISINLIFVNKNFDTVIFKDAIELLKTEYPDKFKVTKFYTQLEINNRIDSVYYGRINSNGIEQILLENNNIFFSQHFICGPSGFSENILNSLIFSNIPKDAIFIESFETSIDPSDFENLEDKTIKIIMENIEFDIFVKKGKSILEAALDFGLDIPYSCQTGICNTCVGKLKNGSVKMIGIKNAINHENEYLLCRCFPLEGNIEILLE